MPTILRQLGRLHRMARTAGVRGTSTLVLEKTAPWRMQLRHDVTLLAARLRYGRPHAILGFRGGIGDDLVCTILCRELRRRGVGPLWMMSKFPALFEHNADVARVMPWNGDYRSSLRRRGWNYLNPRYFRYGAGEDRSILLEPDGTSSWRGKR